MLRKRNLWKGLAAVFLALLSLMLVLTSTAWNNAGTINSTLKVETTKIVKGEGTNDTAYFKSDYGDVNALTAENYQKLLQDEYAHSVSEQEEGSVLLKNDNNALPLAKGAKITLLGHATVDPYYKANSGGTWENNSSMLLTYVEAMRGAGFVLNEEVITAYEEAGGTRTPSPGVFGQNTFNLAENPASFYTSAVTSTFQNFSDAAVVMLARTGGEECDIPMSTTEGISGLALQKNERDLLSLVKQYKDSGIFKKVILLVNAGNAIELGWEEEYGIDAVMWIGGPGFRGFEGVANLLCGEAVPSGRLVDTYAANSMSAPAVVNAGDFSYANAEQVKNSCSDPESTTVHTLVYAENIYIGYRYYETRYEDLMLGRYGADSAKGSSDGKAWDYAEEVVYPFGYGLSYTTFDQTLDGIEVTDTQVIATVTVTNTGKTAAKDVIELYAQTPYGDYERENKVEKSAVQLVGFAKTDVLDAKGGENDSQTLEIAVDKYLLASYDYTNLKGYYLSEGQYYFAIGNGAHEALNNILAQKKADGASVGTLVDQDGKQVSPDAQKTVRAWTQEERDENSYKFSNDRQVTNLFDDCDLNNLGTTEVTYLSRSDWDGTYPAAATIVTATDEMIRQIDGYTYEKPADAPTPASFTQGDRSDDVKENIKLVDMRNVAYDDLLWEDFLDQLTVYEMSRIIIDTGGTVGIDCIAKPAQINQDGPDGAKGSVEVNGNKMPICYPNESVLASSFNIDLVQKRGYYLGEDCLFSGVTQLWCPGINVHRTPFSGRNFEYYSEDPTLAYLMAATQCAEMERKGVNVAPKHLAVNDQETNRHGVSTFLNEQSMREIYLRAFEGAFTKGGATGVMTAYNRIGCTYVGASAALQQELLRGEWGFKGVIISDMVGSGENYQHTIESLVAGTDMFCLAGNDSRADALLKQINAGEGDGYLLQKLREANHHFYYAFSHHNLINGFDSDTVTVTVTPWWKIVVIAVDVSLGVLGAAAAVLFVLGIYVIKKKPETTGQGG